MYIGITEHTFLCETKNESIILKDLLKKKLNFLLNNFYYKKCFYINVLIIFFIKKEKKAIKLKYSFLSSVMLMQSSGVYRLKT